MCVICKKFVLKIFLRVGRRIQFPKVEKVIPDIALTSLCDLETLSGLNYLDVSHNNVKSLSGLHRNQALDITSNFNFPIGPGEHNVHLILGVR